MNKNQNTVPFSEKKLLSITDLCAFLSLGKNKAREIGDISGARREIGSRVLYDRVTIEQYIDKMGA